MGLVQAGLEMFYAIPLLFTKLPVPTTKTRLSLLGQANKRSIFQTLLQPKVKQQSPERECSNHREDESSAART